MQYTLSDGFLYYKQLVEKEDFMALFKSDDRFVWYESITESQSQFRYAEGKWSIKQIIGHITDHERIMTYRMLRFSRKDETLLPGYDQDLLVTNSRFDEIPWAKLLEDFRNVRQASLSLIKNFSVEQLQLTGKAWKYTLTVEEFIMATIGHEMHHFSVLKERYFPQE
ncbi:MAG: DinB family protein [Bacteroidota bacterium]